MSARFTIDRLGHRGDGVVETGDGPLFIAHALAGETVLAERTGPDRARLVEIVDPAPDRVRAFDPAEPICGGCGMRHLAPEAQRVWKHAIVCEALRLAHIEADVAPCRDAHGAGRRRASMHVRRAPSGAALIGFNEAKSHQVVDLGTHDCPILSPALAAAVGPVRAIAAMLLSMKKPIDAVVTTTLTGVDLDLRGSGRPPERTRLALVEAAADRDLARLSVHGEVVVERRPPVIEAGGVALSPPPGGFLQATAMGEDVLAALVAEAVGDAGWIADLFAGSGTFALRLAAKARVHAVENDRPALAALDRAARRAQGLKPVTTEARDLFRRPLTPPELSKFDAVVFDPPRAGAEAQSRAIAASKVSRVAAVSCNPATLARDLAILTEGGFRIASIVPVDQFRHSAHIEVVAALTR